MSGISFSGLSSGIDFDSLRSALLSIEQAAIKRLSDKQDKFELQQTAFKDVNGRLGNLITKMTPILATGSSDMASKVSATSSNSGVFTASALTTAVAGSYDVRVKNLALSESIISKQGASVGPFTASVAGSDLNAGVIDGTTLLSSLNGGAGIADQASGLKIRNGSSTTTVDISAATTVGDVLTAINTSGAGVTASINGAANGLDLTSDTANRSTAIEENGGSTAANLGIFGSSHVLEMKTAADGSYFKVYLDGGRDGNDASLSLGDIRDSINSVAGKTFSSSVVDNRLQIQSSSLGAANALQLKDNKVNAGIFEEIGMLITDALDDATISNAFAGDNTQGGYLQAAKDATFSVNGLTVTRSKNTGIDDVITGVTLNLVAASSSTGAVFPTDYAASTLTIAKDTTSMANTIEEFVAQYNSLTDFINFSTQVNPESDDGVLAGNSTARSLRDSLFQKMTQLNGDVGQEYRSIFEIKDSSGNYVFKVSKTQSGQIELNKAALTDVLSTNPDAVMESMRFDSDADGVFDGGVIFDMNQLAKDYNATTTGILDTQIKSFTDQIDRIDEDILRSNDRLQRRDDMLKRQFSTAEQLIATMQNQSNYISGQMTSFKK